ncbi:uncharacterized protein K444DRAFT_629153 [Hyaloscypha bicolor E]|uniref:Uncharacterized protein n=1 Tax=Hyaloscypha bicolor E TaxID=1095630 RepID=A0A2J6TCA3_9HELO|nr:uncharacterized protein K444DRAFT_629153 [Hyaloscypha bicolor E]PMD60664.1 hypothetical protein K444DRAFT_629153 [Hyaloscypha bicolor E]
MSKMRLQFGQGLYRDPISKHQCPKNTSRLMARQISYKAVVAVQWRLTVLRAPVESESGGLGYPCVYAYEPNMKYTPYRNFKLLSIILALSGYCLMVTPVAPFLEASSLAAWMFNLILCSYTALYNLLSSCTEHHINYRLHPWKIFESPIPIIGFKQETWLEKGPKDLGPRRAARVPLPSMLDMVYR